MSVTRKTLARLALPKLLASLALLPGQPAQAQDATRSPDVGMADKQVYTPADFERFKPRNALDMLSQVPGFTIRQANNERGLGQASENVLLNGQRVTNKSGGARAELQKISADQVERIEIVDGASLDIPGLSGQVANVVIKAQSKGSGQFAWYPGFAAHYADPYFFRGSIGYSGKLGRVGYTFGFDSGGNGDGYGGSIILTDIGGQVIERRREVLRFDGYFPKLSARLNLDGPGAVHGGANLSYKLVRDQNRRVSDRVPVSGTASTRITEGRTRGSELEAGGDLSFGLFGAKLKLIGLLTINEYPSVSTGVTTTGGGPATGDKLVNDRREKETVGRVEYGWKWGEADLQLSGEAAYNSLDGAATLFLLDSGGVFVETPFPGGSGEVKESRYEILGSYGRPIAPGLTMQLVVGGEHSTLSAGTVSRTYLRYKGSASFAWQADANNDVSLKLARVVGQLYFGDFLSSINLVDQRQKAGNVNLVPPQSWEAALELNRKLGRWGSTHVKLYGELIEDIVDTIPIGNRVEALGNIDSATRFGIDWQSTILFDPIGLKGVKLDASLGFQRSRVRDPLTGERRAISYDMLRHIDIELRHDIPGGPWAWGSYFGHGWNAKGVQLSEIGRNWRGPVFVSAYVENKDVFGLTVRASVDNIANRRDRRIRVVHDGWRTDPVLFREERNALIGPKFEFSVHGNF